MAKKRKLDIMIVDDDPDALKSLRYALSYTGHNIIELSDPLDALNSYKENRTDIVITDVRMPKMNGIELLKKIRKADSKAKVIIITAYGDLKTAKEAINNRAYGFLGKPLNLEELIGLIKEIEKEINNEDKLTINVEELKKSKDELKKIYNGLLKEINKLEKDNSR